MSSCNRQVTSTSIHMANQARLAFLAVTHRYKQNHCLWLEQFQIAEYALIHPVPSGADVARRLSVMARRRRACRPAHHARRSIPQEGQAPALGPRRSPNLAAFGEMRRCRQGNKPFCLGRVVICRPHGEMNPPCPRRTALTSNSSPAPRSMITSPASWP